jgi:retinol dehydrogenase-12
MNDQTCIITGANSGVGYEAASTFAELGASVVLVCRSRERGEDAVNRIRDNTPSAVLRLEVADLSSFPQVRILAETLAAQLSSVDILVNNAGVYRAALERTEDGFEQTFAVNHLSHFLLTHLLLPRLLDGSGRVINVASEAHRRGRLTSETLDETFRGRSHFDGWKAYSSSKLANILFTRELARRYSPEALATCSVHPGVLATRLWNQNRNPISRLMVLFKPLMGPARVGGDAVVNAAQAEAGEIHGRYFNKQKLVDPTPMARDDALARDLWELSLSSVGLTTDGT